MSTEESKKKGKLIGLIVGSIAFVISYFGVQQLFKKDLESELKSAALELNRQTPIRIDDFIRLDSAATLGKTNFIYHYTLLGIDKTEVNLDTVNKYLRPDIINNIKTSPELKVYRDNGITMDYKYYDKNGAFALKISVTPEIYNQK